jgi:sugar/nucleoside kinase (ribokinase family)
MSRVAVAGVVNVRLAHAVERFPVPFASSQHRLGALSVRLSGTGWTNATTLRALGSEVVFATYVGSDALGLVATHGLRARGWYGATTLVCEEQPRALVLYDLDGARAGTTDLRSVRHLSYPPEVFAAALDEWRPDVAMLNCTQFTEPLLAVAIAREVPIATDVHRVTDANTPGKQEWMRSATILACSHEQLPHGPYAWIEAVWRRFGTPLTLVGCGPEGALVGVGTDRAVWHVGPATPRGVRYTSGAGDTLLAAFVHHDALADPVMAARYAVLAAGWKVGGGPEEEFALSGAELAGLGDAHGLPVARRLC